MIIDGLKMKSARDRRAMTQETLAHQARVNVRTIQRAESGDPIRHETLADIAAALGVPAAGLIKPEAANDLEPEPESDVSQTQVLKRVEGGDSIISLLERATMSVLDCTAEPTEKNMPVLRVVIEALEGLIRSPWDEHDTSPLRFASLLLKLEATANLNTQLLEMEKIGLALYSAASTVYVRVPYHHEEGMVVRGTQRPSYVTAARFMIAPYDSERIRVSADVIWPLTLEPEPVSTFDLDDEVPF